MQKHQKFRWDQAFESIKLLRCDPNAISSTIAPHSDVMGWIFKIENSFHFLFHTPSDCCVFILNVKKKC